MKLSTIMTSFLIREADETSSEVSQDTVGENSGGELQQLWDETGSNAATYRPKSVFQVKKIGDEYEVNSVAGDTRKLIGKMSKEELDKKYIQTGDTNEPDAEGYVPYTANEQLEAFQYEGESKIIHNGAEHASLIKSDYIVKRQKGDSFEFLVVKQPEFESKYEEVV